MMNVICLLHTKRRSCCIMRWKMISFVKLLPQRIIVTRGRIRPIAGVTNIAFIHSEPTAIAGKTGFTKAAGRTLATYFEKDGKNIIVVTLNDGDDWNTHKNLANKVFSSFKMVTVAKKGVYDILPGVEAELAKPIRLLLKKGEKSKLSNVLIIPRGKNEKSTGHWTVSLGNEPLITSGSHYKTMKHCQWQKKQ